MESTNTNNDTRLNNKELSKAINHIYNNQIQIYTKLHQSDIFNDLKESIAQMQEAFKPVIEIVKQQQSSIAEITQNIDIDFKRLMEEDVYRRNHLPDIMIKLNYPPIDPSILPFIIGGYIHDVNATDKQQMYAINHAITNSISFDDLQDIINVSLSTNQFKPQKKYIDEIIGSYKYGFYANVVMQSYAQIESLLRTIYYSPKYLTGIKKERFSVPIQKDVVEVLLTNPRVLNANSNIERVAKHYYNEILLRSFDSTNNDDIHFVNRHTILHGANTSYGSKSDALKAILLLDYFMMLIIEFKKEHRKQGKVLKWEW